MSDVLAHHGILGMKWGVRRTPEQLARARGSKESEANKKVVAQRKSDLKKKRIMSDAELRQRIDRLKLEREFSELTKNDITPGRQFVSDVMSSGGKRALAGAVAGGTAYAVKVAMTKEFNLKEAAGYIAANPNKKK